MCFLPPVPHTLPLQVPPTDYQFAQCNGDRFECQKASIECEECHEYVDEVKGTSYTHAPTRVCSGGSWTNEDKTCTRYCVVMMYHEVLCCGDIQGGCVPLPQYTNCHVPSLTAMVVHPPPLPSFRRVCETRKPTDVQHIHYIEPDMEDKTNCGDAVEFECEKCYESPQEMSHKCQPSKQWSGDIPTCTMSTCSVEPKSIKHCEYNNNKNDCGDKRYLLFLANHDRSSLYSAIIIFSYEYQLALIFLLL